MNRIILRDYKFVASTKKITLTGLDTPYLAGILIITNVTTNTIIYQFNNPALGGTLTGNVLTLDYDTTSMSNTDSLQIIYEEVSNGLGSYLLSLVKFIADSIAFPTWATFTATGHKVQAVISNDSVFPASNITTVATLTNLTNLNTLDSRDLIYTQLQLVEQISIRNKIT